MTVLQRTGQRLAAWFRAATSPSRIPPERRKPLWPFRGWVIVAALIAGAGI